MKKIIISVFLMFLLFGCAGNAKTINTSSEINLDNAIQAASSRIDERLSPKTKIALLNFDSPTDDFSKYVLDELTANLVDSGYLTVVDRKEVDLIRNEFDFQFSGEVSDDSMQEIGRMLGAQSIVSGSLTKLGNLYRIVIRVLNVQSAEVVVQYRTNIADDKIVQALLLGGKSNQNQAIVQKNTPQPAIAQTDSGGTTQLTTSPASTESRSYNIGDTGPAGGLIFYDKGNNNGGWQYLEAAPARADTLSRISVRNTEVSGLGTSIGDGKQNTEIIVNVYKQTTGEWDTVAQYCDNYKLNGFDDWFLPSRDELDQMYGQLKRRNLGNFKEDDSYYSSSRDGSRSVYVQSFKTGRIETWSLSSTGYVRPIRQF